MMAHLSTPMGQIPVGQLPRNNLPPVVNQRVAPPVAMEGIMLGEAGGEINRGRRYIGDLAYRKRGGDNFVEDYYDNHEFRPPRGLEYVKL